MDSILQELYHGMLCPEEEYQPTEEVSQMRMNLDERQQAITEQMKKIEPDLSAEILELFETENMIDAMEMEAAYIQGMRMGAKLAAALLKEKP